MRRIGRHSLAFGISFEIDIGPVRCRYVLRAGIRNCLRALGKSACLGVRVAVVIRDARGGARHGLEHLDLDQARRR